MSLADHFRAFARALADDRNLVLEMGTILRRAPAVNLDFRATARRRLEDRIQLLLQKIDRECRLLDAVDLYAAGDQVHHARVLARDLDRCLDRARESAFAFSRALQRAYRLDPDREPRLAVLGDVARALHESAALVNGLAGICVQQASSDTAANSPNRRPPLRASRRIVSLAVRFLPWDERQRYLDEYVSELDALAQEENLSPRAQVGHALRLLARTPGLLFALRSSAPRTRSSSESSVTGLVESRSDT
ncbi:hypothetical protein [Amycolatopsis sp. NPDC004079]|uniref:hypothetical protein n=1 Tax=Amycolatopsis sp. NPDC004079 TaxID=3154549 RepID=UPI0033BD18BA